MQHRIVPAGVCVLLGAPLALGCPSEPVPGGDAGRTTLDDAPSSDAGSSPGVAPYFDPSVSWNRPVSELGTSTRYAEYAQRLYDYASYVGWENNPEYDPSRRGEWLLALRDYSVPIYDRAQATTTVRVFEIPWAQSLGVVWTGVAIGDEMPWNPTWLPGSGSDRIMAIVDTSAGRAWEIWGADFGVGTCGDFLGPNNAAGYDPTSSSHLCMASVSTYDRLFDGRTTITGRGMGINKLALITRAVEVRSGEIRHALEMTVFNTMFGGPICEPASSGEAAGAGSDCGFFLPPATRVEWSAGPTADCGANNQPNTPETRRRTVPEGMRFRLAVSDEEIESWLTERAYTGARRNTARIFAVALRDYGWVIAETGCYGVGIETDGMMEPGTRAIWEELGLTDDDPQYPSGDLLFGLFRRDAIEVVEPR